MGLDPGVFGRFDLAALVQPHLRFLFVCLFSVVHCICVTGSQESSPAQLLD